MKFVFFGTPEFAAVILEKLVNAGFAPAAVVCNPDRPVGRKKIVAPPPVKRWVKGQGSRVKEHVEILQPEKLDASFKFQVSSFKPEFAVVTAFAKIIPKEIIELFPRGMVGVHPSLLPKYRGATPIQSAILGGEGETGVTLYLLDEKVDHGQIISQQKFEIRNSKFEILAKELADLGGKLLIETLPKFLVGDITPQPQDEVIATYTKKFTREEAFVPPEDLLAALEGNTEKATRIDRKIRALNPEPGTWTTQNGKCTKLFEATIQNGRLVLKKIQIEGEKPRLVF